MNFRVCSTGVPAADASYRAAVRAGLHPVSEAWRCGQRAAYVLGQRRLVCLVGPEFGREEKPDEDEGGYGS